MSILVKHLNALTHSYVRKGSKANRRRQVQRMHIFVDWVASQEALGSLERLGKRHVILFWQAHRHLSENTRYRYWLALCVLWQLLERTDKPPRPFG